MDEEAFFKDWQRSNFCDAWFSNQEKISRKFYLVSFLFLAEDSNKGFSELSLKV